MEDNKKTETKKQQKISYEQLETVANQLFEQNKQLRKQLDAFQYEQFKFRMECLFKIMGHTELYEPAFVAECANEIQNTIKIPAQETETKE